MYVQCGAIVLAPLDKIKKAIWASDHKILANGDDKHSRLQCHDCISVNTTHVFQFLEAKCCAIESTMSVGVGKFVG